MTWFLVTIRRSDWALTGHSNSYLIPAADGAMVEDILKRHDLGQSNAQTVSWEPLDDIAERYSARGGLLDITGWSVL